MNDIIASFLAGLASFVSPCVLPLVPAYISYISGVSVEDLVQDPDMQALKRTGSRSVFFVFGFSTVFIALGAGASQIGQLLAAHQSLLMKVGGVVIVILGLNMMGVFRISALYSEKRFHVRFQNVGLAGAFLIGVFFALGWTPCIGPQLSAILMLASTSETMWRGVGLLTIYSLGLGIPFLITGFATGSALRVLSKLKPHYRKVELVSGILLIGIGILIFTGGLQSSGFALQQWFAKMFRITID